MISLYGGLNPGSTDPETDDIPMCHFASLLFQGLTLSDIVFPIFPPQNTQKSAAQDFQHGQLK